MKLIPNYSTTDKTIGLIALTGGLLKVWLKCCYIWPLPPQNLFVLEKAEVIAELVFVIGVMVFIVRSRAHERRQERELDATREALRDFVNKSVSQGGGQ